MDNRTRMTGSTGSAGYRLEKTIVERVVSDPTIYSVITRGWQSLFATETGGLSPTGNSVASAEQTSAARP